MQRHGVAGTGIAQILESSGVTRRSIYLNFPGGKSELVTAATRCAGEDIAATIGAYIDEPNPIAAFAHMWCQILLDTDFEGGCPIVAAACCGEDNPGAAAAAAEVFAAWSRLLTDRLVHDGIADEVAQSLATMVVASVEGSVILSRAARSTAPLEQVARHLEELIAANRPTTRRGTP